MAERRDREADRAFFERRGFSKRIGFGERPALLVIDLMTAFTDSEMPLGSDLDAELAQANRLIRAAHTGGIPVLFTMVAYEEEGCRDAGLWTLKLSGTFSLAAGGPGVEIDPRLERRPEDPVINKTAWRSIHGWSGVRRTPSSTRSSPRPSSAPISPRASSSAESTP